MTRIVTGNPLSRQRKKMKKNEIEKTMPIEEAIRLEPAVPTILMAMGLDSIGVPLLRGQSIEDICNAQEIDADDATDRINEFIRNKKLSKSTVTNGETNHE